MIAKKIAVLRKKFIGLFRELPLEGTMLDKIENLLKVKFPDCVVKITHFYPGNYLKDVLNFNDKKDDEHGITYMTLAYRNKINLPVYYVVLGQDEVSSIVLDTHKGQVLWLSYSDVCNLCESQPFTGNPIIFPTFTDFFAYLLDEEEKSRGSAA